MKNYQTYLKAIVVFFTPEIYSLIATLNQPHPNWKRFGIDTIAAAGLAAIAWAVPNKQVAP